MWRIGSISPYPRRTGRFRKWQDLPSRVEANFPAAGHLQQEQRNGHCFLGWVGEHFLSGLKCCAAARGYKSLRTWLRASPGLSEMSRQEFQEDRAALMRHFLEDVAGCPVPSATARLAFGYLRCSVVFRCTGGRGLQLRLLSFPGCEGTRRDGIVTARAASDFAKWIAGYFRISITVADVLGRPVCFFGAEGNTNFPACG